MTFTPITNSAAASPGRGTAQGHLFSSTASMSSMVSTSSRAKFNAAPKALYTGAVLGSTAERAAEDAVNRHLQADPEKRPPTASLPKLLRSVGSRLGAAHSVQVVAVALSKCS